MTELEQLKTLLTNIETLISQYKTSITTPKPVIEEDLSTNINNWFTTNLVSNKDKTLISGYVHPYKWTRNVNCWASNLDFTGTSVGIWGLGGVGGGTLITRKHILLANHVPYPTTPFTIFFANKNNNYYEYKVTRTKRVGTTDILIGELDKETDPSLKVYNVLPANFTKYFTPQPISNQPRFPIIYSDQEKKVLIGDYISTFNNTPTEKVIHITSPNEPNKSAYYEQVVVGDSGNPIYTIINNDLVLMGGWYMSLSTGGLGSSIPSYISDINSIIASFSVGYKLNEASLAGFKTYN